MIFALHRSRRIMSNRIPSIPTRYRGVNYRSRLEARWAAMFDTFGWAHEYEPIDLRGYIPDFIVLRPGIRDTLFECKPFTTFGENEAEHCTKIYEAGWKGPAALVGATLRGNLIGRWTRSKREPWVDCFVAMIGGKWFECDTPPEPTAHERLALRVAWSDAGNAVQWNAP